MGGRILFRCCLHRLEKGDVKRYHVEDRNPIISTNYIYSIYPDGDLLWFGGIMGDITSLNIKTGLVNKYNISKVNQFERQSDRLLVMGLYSRTFYSQQRN